uniref:Shugoshin C-terminal domain-containing protein n=1 Tax=Brassica campestris TaxID=3711 RepID=M4EZ71_BRACM
MVRTRTTVLKVADHSVEGVSTNKAKGEKMIQDPRINSAQRRTLGDITNLPNQKLKALQHELSCKNGVLIARKLPLESRVSGRSSPANSEVLDIIGRPGESAQTTNMTRRVSLRRQSRRFNIQELGVTENLNGIHDDQEAAAKSGCSASDLSIGSKPEAVELHDTKERTRESRRVSSRRQSTEVTSQRDIKVSTDPPLPDGIVEESSQVSSSVSTELKRESKNKPAGDEAEEMRETYAGRPSRQATGKIKSYKEVSLKDKMRRDF